MKNFRLFFGMMTLVLSLTSHAEIQKPIPKGLRTASVVAACTPAALITGTAASVAAIYLALGTVMLTPTDTMFYVYNKTAGNEAESFQFTKGLAKDTFSLIKDVETAQFDGKSMCQKMQDRVEESQRLGETESNSRSISSNGLNGKSDLPNDIGTVKKNAVRIGSSKM